MVSLPSYSFSCVILIIYVILFHSQLCYGKERDGKKWHVIEGSKLIQKSVCTREKDILGLPLVHQHGSCSPFKNIIKPSHTEILNRDQTRVNRIHKQSRKISPEASSYGSKPIQVPDQPGRTLNTGNFIVQVGIGTPTAYFSVILDTGSDVSWIQCLPCSNSSCYSQQDPLFNPSKSSTYSSLLCGSNECRQLDYQSRTCYDSTSNCHYEVQYGDNSQTEGNLVRDTLKMGSNRIPNFLFGCGNNNSGLFGKAAGLIGLGRGNVSLVSQLSSKYGATFSYCLPSTTDSKGYLRIGGGAPKFTKYTQMIFNSDYPSFYFVKLIGLKVGGELLSVPQTVFSNPGTVLDSGTVITRLPSTAYKALRDNFQSLMTEYNQTKPLLILDTCYNFTGYEDKQVSVPSITFMFSNGANIDIDFTGILYVADISQACLAFAPNSDDNEIGIIGNVQQRKFNVMYDIHNNQIGFTPNACS